MDNEEYASLYGGPYSGAPGVRRSQVFRETIDARFQAGNFGLYGGAGAAENHWSAGTFSGGVFNMPNAWTTTRFGGIGLIAGGNFMAGPEVGIRFHTATRLAPYVGVSGVLAIDGFARHIGYSRYRSNYYYDSSGHAHYNPRWGYVPTAMLAIAPEAGISYWLTPSVRWNVGATYYITGQHYPDFLLVGTSLEFSRREASPEPEYIPSPEPEESSSTPYFVPAAEFKLDPDAIIERPGPESMYPWDQDNEAEQVAPPSLLP